MNTWLKLAAFGFTVAATFGGAMAVGAVVGPLDVGGGAAGHGGHGAAEMSSADLPRGLAIAEAGFRLVPEVEAAGPTVLAAGTPTTFAFRIVTTDGTTVTAFEQLHERALHLIVLSRNLVDYLHTHPAMDPQGRWSVQLPALSPGSYRIFADFQPVGAANLTLGTDVSVPGDVAGTTLPKPATTTTVDGYTVTLAGHPAVGSEPLTFSVQRDGATVRTDPYLGAAGHLVAIRAGDMAYLHVHPDAPGDDPAVTFMGEFPTPGTYRLFFDFSHGGAVHTASFTVEVP